MSCKYCTPREGTDLCGEYAWDVGESLDCASSGRIGIWWDEEDGYQFTLLVDGPRPKDFDHKLYQPSTASLKLPCCPFCGRRLDG